MEQEKKNQNQNGAQELSVGDQIKVRREKLANLQAEGHNPFEITKFVQTTNSREIRENFDAMEGKPVSIAGRMMSKRGMGKVSFCDLQDKDRPHPALRPQGRDGRGRLQPLQEV